MVPIFISNALVSDGFNNAPALRQQANGEVLFNVGHRIPDPQAQGGSRWINFEITVPPALVPLLNQLSIKAKTWVNILATVDTRATVDKNGQTKNHRVYIARFIELVPQSASKQQAGQPAPVYNNGAPVQNYVNNGQPLQQTVGYTGPAEFGTPMY